MRADRNFHCPTIEFGEPLSRNAQLGLRAPPEKIRGSGWNNQAIRSEIVKLRLDLARAEPLQLRIDEQWLVPSLPDLIKRKEQLKWIMRLMTSKIS